MNILLTGGTGNLGQCLIPELEKSEDVTVFAWTHDEFDITEPRAMWDKLCACAFDVVVHCAAMTDVPGCEKNPKRAHLVNALGTGYLAQMCSQLDRYFVYISTDYVFDGKVGFYKEDSTPAPINTYGQTKLCGEIVTQTAYYLNPELFAIIRTSLKPLGVWPYPKAFTDIYSSADYVDIIAQEIALAIRMQVTGVIHIATERKSIYELAKRRTPTVQPMSRKEIQDVELPFDVSLDIRRWTELKERVERQYYGATRD